MAITLKMLADALDAELAGPPDLEIHGIKGMDEASRGQLTFIDHPRMKEELEGRDVAAAIVPLSVKTCAHPVLRVKNTRLAFAKALELFHPPAPFTAEIDGSAVIEEGAIIEEGCSIGAQCVVEAGARIAGGARLMAQCVIGRGSTVGRDTLLHPGVKVYPRVQIGERCIIQAQAILGCAPPSGMSLAGEARLETPPPPGDYSLVIEDDVEIGARAVVERGLARDTVIGAGTKIDNVAVIHHGCRLGRRVIVVSTVCIGPNTTVGDWCVFAAQAYVAGNLEIGKGSIVAGRCTPRGDVPPGSVVSGEVARDHKEDLRRSANLMRFYELARESRDLLK